MSIRDPSQNKLDQFFRSDRSAALKIGGSSVLVAALIARYMREQPWEQLLGGVIFGAGFGALAGTLLCLKDATRQREEEGQPIDPVNKLLFASGIGSVLLWIVVAIVAAIVGVMCYAIYYQDHVAPAG